MSYHKTRSVGVQSVSMTSYKLLVHTGTAGSLQRVLLNSDKRESLEFFFFKYVNIVCTEIYKYFVQIVHNL